MRRKVSINYAYDGDVLASNNQNKQMDSDDEIVPLKQNDEARREDWKDSGAFFKPNFNIWDLK